MPRIDYLAPAAGAPVRTSTLTLPAVAGRDVPLRVVFPATPGPHPVVVFSHGARCYPERYAGITDTWAAHGYVVILPDHLDSPNNPVPPRPDQLGQLLGSRIAELEAIIDALPDLAARAGVPGGIDLDRVAVGGHSFGSMIAMAKAGLLMKGADGAPVSYRNARVRAAVVMSGVGQMDDVMAPGAFSGLDLPVIATGGTLDEGNVGGPTVYPWEWRLGAYDLAPPGAKYRVVLERGDHYLGGLICRPDRGGPPDPDGVRLDAGLTLAFLDAHVRGDAGALAWLRTADVAAGSGGRVRYARK